MRILFLIVLFVSVVGCASAPEHRPGPFQAPVHRGLAEDSAVERPFLVEDPWEGFNRRMYHFNAQLDRYVYLPVVNVYEEILPDPVQQGVSNIFNNLKEISIFVNSVLQGKAKKASVSLGRFIFNTTIGVGAFLTCSATGASPRSRKISDRPWVFGELQQAPISSFRCSAPPMSAIPEGWPWMRS